MPLPAPSPPPGFSRTKLSHRTYGRRGKMVLERLGGNDKSKASANSSGNANGSGSGSGSGSGDSDGEMEVELPPKGSRDVGESSPLTSPPPEDLPMIFGGGGDVAAEEGEGEGAEDMDATPKAKKRSREDEVAANAGGSQAESHDPTDTFPHISQSSPSHKRQRILPITRTQPHKPPHLPLASTAASHLAVPSTSHAHALVTPPESELSRSMRQRQAAHTPKTPPGPRDLQEVLGRREASPSPVGTGERGNKRGGEGEGDREGGGGSGDGRGGGGAAGGIGASTSASATAAAATPALPIKLGQFPGGRRTKRKMMTRTESLGEKEKLFTGPSTSSHAPGPSTSTLTFANDSFLLKSPEKRTSTLPFASTSALPTTPPRLGKSHSTNQVTTPSPSRNPLGRSGSGSIPNSPSRPVLRQAYSTSTALAAMSGGGAGPSSLMGMSGVAGGGGGGRPVRTYGKRQNAVDAATSGNNTGNISVAGLKAREENENEREEQFLKPLNGDRPVPVHQDSYAELNKRYGIDVQEEEDTQDSQGSAADMRVPAPLAELRSRGENRRFMDDLGYLRDGLRDDSLAARRDSATDIINQCTDSTWYDRLRICGQLETIFVDLLHAAGQESDKASTIAVILYLFRVATSSHDFDTLMSIHSEDVVDFLVKTIRERDAVFESAVGDTKRKKASAMQTLRNMAKRIAGIGSQTRQSLSPLALSAELLIRCLDIDDELLTGRGSEDVVSTARAVASALQSEMDGLHPRIELYNQGLDIFTPASTPDFALVSRCAQLLVTLCEGSEAVKPILGKEYSALAARFADFLLIVSHGVDTPPISPRERSDLIENLLKLVVAVMQVVPAWGKHFLSAHAPYVALTRFMTPGDRKKPKRLERSISPAGSEATETSENDQDDLAESAEASLTNLALGCMYNLVQEDNMAGANLANIYIGQPCQGGFKCLLQCRCPQRISAPQQIVRLLAYQQEHKAEDPHASFLSGFLAILIARICEHSSDARSVILESVPGETSVDRYQYLLDIVNEFTVTYRDFQSQLTKGVRKQLGLDQDEGFEVVINDSVDSGNISRAVQIYEGFIRDVRLSL